VHGEPQQGGYLPAEIWHAYMSRVTEGKPCLEFPQPKETLSYQPFYGKFASTGQAVGSSESEGPSSEHKKSKSEKGSGSPGGATPAPPKGPASERGPATPPAPQTPGKTGGAPPG
jgi:membrane carboxypeptidase/penicillin-binding protein